MRCRRNSRSACAVGCDLLVALLRQAQGGATSGYSPLVLVPVVWTALVLGRRGVLVISACTFLFFALPILIEGSPLYPSNGWRGVVLWFLIALFVGLGRRARDAGRAGADRDRQGARPRARPSGRDPEHRRDVRVRPRRRARHGGAGGIAADRSRCGGRRDPGPRAPRLPRPSGTAEAHLGFRLPLADTISGLALRTRETLVCEDTETDERVDREACRRVGARSLVVVPLLHDAEAAGVLKVFSASRNAFRPEHVRVLTLLADMIGSALARAELLEKLHHLALTDELTGLPNRRSWYDHLEHALARARRSAAPLSVVVLDVNGFKQVNDRQGHAAGDRLLRTASACWSSVLRDSDVLGRVGGDEFAVILEQTDSETAAGIAARLEASLPAGGVSVATGIAGWNREEDAEALLSRADAAMYERKGETGAEAAHRPGAARVSSR